MLSLFVDMLRVEDALFEEQLEGGISDGLDLTIRCIE
jgi:hypothetical protein